MSPIHLIVHLLTAVVLPTGIIHFNNGSFEGEPADATMPVGWLACQPGTTPDILPGYWGVTNDPSDGDTFIGLITRGDGSWESICQRLEAPVEKGQCYQFTVDLAHATTYAGYGSPLRLRVWGGKTRCRKDQLLFTSDRIESEDWEKHPISFTAELEIHYLQLEAFHEDKTFSYRGNILIDNLSPLKPCVRANYAPPAPYPLPGVLPSRKVF